MGTGRAGHVERVVAAAVEQEAVDIAGSICVSSYDLARRVDPETLGIGRAGHVECGGAAAVEQEAADCAVRHAVISHDLARRVYTGSNGIGRAGYVERGVAALIKQQAVDCQSTGLSSEKSPHLAQVISPGSIGADHAEHLEPVISSPLNLDP